jgi:GMP synthase (glutamine-hydrolysing)
LKSAVAIRHVHFEDLGTFDAVLRKAGYGVAYLDVDREDLARLDSLQPDLLAILGAPVGVYEEVLYPFLKLERELLATRLDANLPTLGICLGAQQIAAALGAKVYPGGVKEIGFGPVQLTEAGRNSPLRHLDGVPVLHWHGDVFEIPDEAARLAGTPLCPNQAFSLGSNVLALQFHPEVNASLGVESWLIGHAAELAAAKVDPRTIRFDAQRYAATLHEAAHEMFEHWLGGIESSISTTEWKP